MPEMPQGGGPQILGRGQAVGAWRFEGWWGGGAVGSAVSGAPGVQEQLTWPGLSPRESDGLLGNHLASKNPEKGPSQNPKDFNPSWRRSPGYRKDGDLSHFLLD